MTLLPCLNETRSANGLIRLLLILEMPLKIEFVFLTEDCQVLKLSLFDPRWPKTLQINERMKLNDDDKTSLMIDGSEVDCVLLKHGPPGAMDVEFRKNQEIYGAFADQCSGNLDVTPRKGARWAGSSLTPVESFGPESTRVLVRSLAFVFFIFMNGVKIKFFLQRGRTLFIKFLLYLCLNKKFCCFV